MAVDTDNRLSEAEMSTIAINNVPTVIYQSSRFTCSPVPNGEPITGKEMNSKASYLWTLNPSGIGPCCGIEIQNVLPFPGVD